ncbi:hypothetical protein U3516DRAFT_567931 [Neocallimastix sp. 'constans']
MGVVLCKKDINGDWDNSHERISYTKYPHKPYLPENCDWGKSEYSYANTNLNNNKYITISKDGKCGDGYGICPGSNCCSKWGYCGVSSEYCDSGCQPNYGYCTNFEGTCGKGYGICPDSKCCSKWGYCGSSSEYCGDGCQPEYGQCD